MKKISAYSRKIWTIKGLITTGIFLAIAVALNISLEFNLLWKYVIICSMYGLALVFFINSLIMSKYRYEKYRYEIDREKIILRYGIFNEKNVVIPMKRVKYVDMKQGVFLRKYRLINLTVHTDGGYYVIPYLESEAGKKVQLSISKIVQERSI
ncbi:PH domain-containing protein [Clostridium sp. FP2]|uniref:PH domain-containing protein n=1 Tax=Clostridium TaxID=1485 RepID=UPI0013E96DEE|nr:MULTISPECIES: PH domain-containing protein [Clostridium]MBW9156709.1 PH domain-containing protein [Clostridium tagluense]MBZ9625076.1 PH domain-containing protein [Clostridium sp. FP2]WLC64868.1 PH domain-containing protein [Clostridium tagluense]